MISIVEGLTDKDAGTRLGFATGVEAIKSHPFFVGVDWAVCRIPHARSGPHPHTSPCTSCGTHMRQPLSMAPVWPVWRLLIGVLGLGEKGSSLSLQAFRFHSTEQKLHAEIPVLRCRCATQHSLHIPL